MVKTEFVDYPKLKAEQVAEYKKTIVTSIDRVIRDISGKNPSDLQAKESLRREIASFIELKEKAKSRKNNKEIDPIDLGVLLKKTGVSEQIANQAKFVVDQVKTDLNQTYAPNLTESQISRIESEGRGFYRKHTVIVPTVSGQTHQIINYIKGTGVKNLVLTAKHDFLVGYPHDSNQLFFDDTRSISGHPRILGTETHLWGMHEHINSALVFSHFVREFGLKNIEEILNARIPIPVGIKNQADLSLYLQSLLSKKYLETANDLERRNLAWIGNWQKLVTVATLVPSTKRLPRLVDVEDAPLAERSEKLQDFVDLKKVKSLGKVIATQLKIGIIFSQSSSHGQNIYDAPDSLLPLADYSDLNFLGGFQDKYKQLYSDVPPIFFSQTDYQIFAVYSSIRRQDGLRPLSRPFLEYGVAYEEVIQANLVYWSQITKDLKFISDRRLALASVYFPQYFEFAVATQHIKNLTNEQKKSWSLTAKLQLKTMNELDPSGELIEVLEDRNANNVSEYQIHDSVGIKNSDTLKSIIHYLKTGDIESLLRNQDTGIIARLAIAIDQIRPVEMRDTMAENLIALQSERDFCYLEELSSLEYKHDFIYLFENKHLDRVLQFIQSRNYLAASRLLAALLALKQINNVDEADLHPENQNINIEMEYAIRLLDAEPSELEELIEQMKYFRLTRSIFASAAGSVMFEVFSSDQASPFKLIEKEGMMHPRDLIINLMGMWYKDKSVRKFVQEYLNYYTEIVNQNQISKETDYLTVLNKLDELADEMSNNMPMLTIAHYMSSLQACRVQKPELSNARIKKLMDTYRTIDTDKLANQTGWIEIKDKRSDIKSWKEELKKRSLYFEERGFNRLAKYYKARSQSRY